MGSLQHPHPWLLPEIPAARQQPLGLLTLTCPHTTRAGHTCGTTGVSSSPQPRAALGGQGLRRTAGPARIQEEGAAPRGFRPMASLFDLSLPWGVGRKKGRHPEAVWGAVHGPPRVQGAPAPVSFCSICPPGCHCACGVGRGRFPAWPSQPWLCGCGFLGPVAVPAARSAPACLFPAGGCWQRDPPDQVLPQRGEDSSRGSAQGEARR